MRSFFVLLLALAGLFSIVPLAIWAATGNWRAAVQAGHAYGRVIGWMVALAAALAMVLAIASAVS